MKGKEEIIKKIIKDAQKIATSTLDEGVVKAQEIIEMAENDAKIYRSRHRKESMREREEILRRKITVANLEAKKIMLGAKQELISQVFTKSLEAIKQDQKGYKKMLKGILKYAMNGDMLTICEEDKDIFTQKFIDEAIADKNIKIKLNKEWGNFQGGLVLSNPTSNKNFTLETQLSLLRDELEPQIAQMLFGD